MSKLFYIVFIVCLLPASVCLKAQENSRGDVVVHAPPGLALLYNNKKPAEKKITAKIETKAVAKTAGITSPTKPAASITTDTKPIENPKKYTFSESTRLTAPNVHLVSTIRHERVIYSGKGFRVQIYYGSDRNKAMKIKTEFMRNFPEVRTYLTYYPPYFRVKVGNYRSRSDALGMLREANSIYSPSMIVPDIVTISTF